MSEELGRYIFDLKWKGDVESDGECSSKLSDLCSESFEKITSECKHTREVLKL